jgi:sarcosine oxidase
VSDTYDAIVIGVGTMGSAACDALARRGQRVLGLEQFSIPHASGAHHGQSRMFRLAYYEHEDYVPLLRRAFDLWQDLERRSGVKLFHVTGALYAGSPDAELMPRSALAAAHHGLDHEILDSAAIQRRFPQFHLPPGFRALWEPCAGFVIPELAVGSMARLALESGATIRARERVVSWQRRADALEVTTEHATYVARRLVVTCGAWTSKLLRDLGIPLLVTRQVFGWVWPQSPERFALGVFPCWAVEAADGSIHYGFPMLPWHPGLKVARHLRAAPADPDHLDRAITADDQAHFRAALTHLRDADGPTLSVATCTYTNSPDSHFIIDRLPSDPAVTLACGFSGHGFKFAPVIGEVLAELALDGASRLPSSFLGLARFA